MLKRATAQFVALALVMILSGSELLAQKRISFRRGASSATVRGKLDLKVIWNTSSTARPVN